MSWVVVGVMPMMLNSFDVGDPRGADRPSGAGSFGALQVMLTVVMRRKPMEL